MDDKDHLLVLKDIESVLDIALKWFLHDDYSNNKDRNAAYNFGVLSEYISDRIQSYQLEKEEVIDG